MRQISFYFRESEILRQICKIRVKIAKNRSKRHLLHQLTSNPEYNYHKKLSSEPRNEFERYQKTLNDELSKILPPRKKWVKIGEDSRRKPNRTNEFLTSNDKNFYALLKTIKLHQKIDSKESWFLNLKNFINEIQESVMQNSHTISKPIIVPQLKEKKKKNTDPECRPICMFNLKDRIVLSLTNKFLTQLFDDKFQDTSYAFRHLRNDKNKIISHHDCILDILKFLKNNENKKFFIVECDMKKFYDTVNHKIVSMKFEDLIMKSKSQYPHINLDFSKKIFSDYLNSYSFNIDVPNKKDVEFWKSYSIRNGYFGWIEKEISKHYLNISTERIGVPQGGALSGLIANILLNDADIELLKSNVFYARFCDDMIVISNTLQESIKAKNDYISILEKLKLFPHPFTDDIDLVKFGEDDSLSYKPFWKGKSKGPYQWGNIENLNFPWIGFVGYEINFNGQLRIRKKSFEKELKKQKTVVTEIRNAIKVGRRKRKGTISESAINRLIGMSVGRIGMNNFEEVSTDLCWKNGFKLLTINSYSKEQIKEFDRNRSKHYYDLLRDLKEIEDDELKGTRREVIKYNKPFSYYYQVLERQKKDDG